MCPADRRAVAAPRLGIRERMGERVDATSPGADAPGCTLSPLRGLHFAALVAEVVRPGLS